MKIINKTKFTTNSLSSIFHTALRSDEKIEGRMMYWQKQKLTIEVVHTHTSRHVSGYAYYNGIYMRLRLPKNSLLFNVVWLFLHELSHIRGAHHNKMSDVILKNMANDIVIANPELVLNAKSPPVKKISIKSPQLIRYEHAKKMLAQKESAIIRLKRSIVKWGRKVRYYERVFKNSTTLNVVV
jgi:hypothetical protein